MNPALANAEVHTLKVQGNVYMIVGPGGNTAVQVGDSGALVVDTQGDPRRFPSFALVKSNQPDAEAALGRRFAGEADVEQGCRRLLDELGAGAIVMQVVGALVIRKIVNIKV